MTESSPFEQVLFVGIVLCMLTLVVGQLLGQPVLLSYVETESMSPTLEPGDGFVPLPTQVAGPIETGDVIVFEAQTLHGGGLTTHRVVDDTERGYITQGDGNPFADQDNEEPPVKQPQIAARAAEFNGQLIVIPGFGTAIEQTRSVLDTTQRHAASAVGRQSLGGSQTIAALFFAATLLWYLVDIRRNEERAQRDRDRSRETGLNTRLILAVFATVLVLGATAAMIVPAGTHEYGTVSSSFDSDRPDIIPAGESNDVRYPVDNSGLLPIVTYLEPASEGVAIKPHETAVQPRTVMNATVTLHAPPETGYYRRFVVEHRYLAVLPLSVIRGLHAIHPWAPIVAIDLFIGGLFYFLGSRLLGSGRLRDRSRSQHPRSWYPFDN